ncbi:hypothetical protein [Pseudanabaena minima]|uniref:hypothetical protein n=1 Tax=Pseudanabaena minima TaxID=890415 RepID=UPI003DA91DB7
MLALAKPEPIRSRPEKSLFFNWAWLNESVSAWTLIGDTSKHEIAIMIAIAKRTNVDEFKNDIYKNKDNGFILALTKSREGDRYTIAIAFPVFENVIKIRYGGRVLRDMTTKSLISKLAN